MKRQFWTSSMIILTTWLSGKSFSSLQARQRSQMAGAFWQPGTCVRLLLLSNMTNRNQTCQIKRASTHSDVQQGSVDRQMSFSGRGNAWKNLPFSGHIVNKLRRPTILQLNIEGLTASKMNVFITLLCSLRHSSSYYRRHTALMQRS